MDGSLNVVRIKMNSVGLRRCLLAWEVKLCLVGAAATRGQHRFCI